MVDETNDINTTDSDEVAETIADYFGDDVVAPLQAAIDARIQAAAAPADSQASSAVPPGSVQSPAGSAADDRDDAILDHLLSNAMETLKNLLVETEEPTAVRAARQLADIAKKEAEAAEGRLQDEEKNEAETKERVDFAQAKVAEVKNQTGVVGRHRQSKEGS